jgi:hypothetical protein
MWEEEENEEYVLHENGFICASNDVSIPARNGHTEEDP